VPAVTGVSPPPLPLRRRGRRYAPLMLRRLVVLTVLLGVLAVADVAARGYAQSELRNRAAAYYPPSAGSDATISSFPFVGRLLVAGDVPSVSVAMTDVRAGGLRLRRVSVTARRVELDRSALFRGRVRVRDIGTGRLEAEVDGMSLAAVTGADLRFGDGTVELRREVRGTPVTATLRVVVQGNHLRLEPTSAPRAGVPPSALAVSYEIPGKAEFFPCRANVRAVRDGLLVGCDVADIPPALVEAVEASG
jgi:hypothetical protein